MAWARTRSAPTPRWHGLTGAIVAPGLALVVPYALMVVVGGSAMRLLYPAWALGLGTLFLFRRPALYPAFCIALFAFTPFMRRVVDYQAGWETFSPVLLAPYTALLPSMLPLANFALQPRRRYAVPFLAIVGCIIYASMVALLQGHILPGLYEPLRWLLPMGLCAAILESPEDAAVLHQTLLGALGVIVVGLAIYGVFQFTDPPPWDVFWMNNLSITAGSFGLPEAFKIRPFSMMNSPGSLGMFLGAAIPVLAGSALIPLSLPGIVMLGLTVVRSGWLACVTGLVVLLARAPLRRRLSLAVYAGVVLVALSAGMGALQFIPDMATMLNKRLDSFSHLSTDHSADDRLQTYSEFFRRFAQAPMGEGFGANESAAVAAEHRDEVTLDSGVLDVFLTYGLVAGTIWFLGIAALVGAAWRACGRGGGKYAGYLGAICGLIVAFPLGTTVTGEIGIIGWAGLGFLLSPIAPEPRTRAE